MTSTLAASDRRDAAAGNVVAYLLGTPDSERPAALAGRDAISHRELTQRARRLAAGLAADGVRRGDIVAIVGDNTIQWVVWYLGVLWRGAVALPLSGRESRRLLGRALEVDGVRRVLCQEAYADRIRSILGERPEVRLPADVRAFPVDDSAPAPSTFPPVDVGRDDLAAIMMTSGSTGDPKGVAVSHRNIEVNTRAILSYLHLRADDRMMVVLPFCYCYGLSLLHTHLRVGASVVLNNRFMFPDKVVEDMDSKRCTGFAGVPSTYHTLLKRSRIAQGTPASLRHVQQAGGHMPVALANELATALGPRVDIFVMYGATEATARLSYLPPACFPEKAGSIGLPVPGVRFEIRDAAGRAVPPGEVGELVAIGETITRGYYDDPESTSARFGERTFHTGDLARVDDDGFYYIEGRKSDFIKSYGYRISPREIEEVIAEHPGVSEAVVFGVPDDESGEAVAVCVVARDSHLACDDIRDYCATRLPNHKTPRYIRIVDQLPRNESGKLLRAQLAHSVS